MFQSIRDEKGKAAEFHVNSTLHHVLGASRFRPNESKKDFYLFDDLILPFQDELTEIDHLLVSIKGLYAIETKSIAGKVFGEQRSYKWFSAALSRHCSDGIYDRGFTNPFRQNMKHIKAIQAILDETGHHHWVNNVVVLVNADATGWEEGKWGGDQLKGLYLSALELASAIQREKSVLEPSEVFKIAEVFHKYYQEREKMLEKFREQIKLA